MIETLAAGVKAVCRLAAGQYEANGGIVLTVSLVLPDHTEGGLFAPRNVMNTIYLEASGIAKDEGFPVFDIVVLFPTVVGKDTNDCAEGYTGRVTHSPQCVQRRTHSHAQTRTLSRSQTLALTLTPPHFRTHTGIPTGVCGVPAECDTPRREDNGSV